MTTIYYSNNNGSTWNEFGTQNEGATTSGTLRALFLCHAANQYKIGDQVFNRTKRGYKVA